MLIARSIQASRWSQPASSFFKFRQYRSVNTVSKMVQQRDVIAIIGTTGVGKTQLAIDLARSVRARASGSFREAEIINADSMQVYRGLDIITNKATKEERNEVPHHLMDILDPGEEYRVDRFREDAMRAVEEISDKGALPIIVGGTMYFLQHLLFPGKLVSAEEGQQSDFVGTRIQTLADLSQEQRSRVQEMDPDLRMLVFDFLNLPLVSTPTSFPPDFPVQALPTSLQDPESYTAAVYQCLAAVDPEMAQRWHWRDIRKVSRSLQVFLQTGQQHSAIMREQAEISQEVQYRTLIFWPYAESNTLEPRLDGRVEQMCTRGLLDEIQELRKIAMENRHLDLSKGIYQAIGYKEFSEYFEKSESDSLEPSTRSPEFKLAVEDMKVGTRQYARRQIKWICNKLKPVIEACKENPESNEVYLYLLDATFAQNWSQDVQNPADTIVRAFLERQPMPDATTLNSAAQAFLMPKDRQRPSSGTPAKIQCEVCTTDASRPFLVEEGEQMLAHKGSRAHRKRVQKLTRRKQDFSRDQRDSRSAEPQA